MSPTATAQQDTGLTFEQVYSALASHGRGRKETESLTHVFIDLAATYRLFLDGDEQTVRLYAEMKQVNGMEDTPYLVWVDVEEGTPEHVLLNDIMVDLARAEPRSTHETINQLVGPDAIFVHDYVEQCLLGVAPADAEF